MSDDTPVIPDVETLAQALRTTRRRTSSGTEAAYFRQMAEDVIAALSSGWLVAHDAEVRADQQERDARILETGIPVTSDGYVTVAEAADAIRAGGAS